MTIFPITVFSSHILSREFWCGCFFGVEFRFLPLNENIVFMIQKSQKKHFRKLSQQIVFNRLGILWLLCDPCKDHRMVELLNNGWSFGYVLCFTMKLVKFQKVWLIFTPLVECYMTHFLSGQDVSILLLIIHHHPVISCLTCSIPDMTMTGIIVAEVGRNVPRFSHHPFEDAWCDQVIRTRDIHPAETNTLILGEGSMKLFQGHVVSNRPKSLYHKKLPKHFQLHCNVVNNPSFLQWSIIMKPYKSSYIMALCSNGVGS